VRRLHPSIVVGIQPNNPGQRAQTGQREWVIDAEMCRAVTCRVVAPRGEQRA
jgi:hypothetical protein